MKTPNFPTSGNPGIISELQGKPALIWSSSYCQFCPFDTINFLTLIFRKFTSSQFSNHLSLSLLKKTDSEQSNSTDSPTCNNLKTLVHERSAKLRQYFFHMLVEKLSVRLNHAGQYVSLNCDPTSNNIPTYLLPMLTYTLTKLSICKAIKHTSDIVKVLLSLHCNIYFDWLNIYLGHSSSGAILVVELADWFNLQVICKQ